MFFELILTLLFGLRPLQGQNSIDLQCPSMGMPDDVDYQCSNGRNIASICQMKCTGGKVIYGTSSFVVCTVRGTWNRDVNQIRCDFDNRCPPVRQSLLPTQSGANCSSCPNNCRPGQICCPSAQGCGSSCISIPQVCTGQQRYTFCHINPCNVRDCHGFPDAICLNNYCGGCSAIYLDPVTNNVIPSFACSRRVDWPACLDKCPCKSSRKDCETGCPKVPDALCIRDCDCRTRFIDSRTGRALTSRECRPVCPSPFQLNDLPSYRLRCRDGFNVGSRCDVTCANGKVLIGIKQIHCLSDTKWNTELGNTQCISRMACPSNVAEEECATPPCESATCPGVPQATCVEDRCGTCSFKFFFGGRRVDRTHCLPKQICGFGFDRRLCGKGCSGQRCLRYPDAICREDCQCQPVFYNSTTYQRVSCESVGDQ